MASGGGVLRELLAVFGFEVDTKSLKKGKDELTEFVEHLKKAGEAVLAAFAVEQIHRFIESQVEAMRAIEHTAQRLGITIEKTQELGFAAESLGINAEQLLHQMGRLQVAQSAAASGSGQQAKAFESIGVSIKDTHGKLKPFDELVLDVADGIAKQGDASKQAAAAVKLFGRGGLELLPFLKEGRKGVEELTQDFKKLGAGYDELTLKKGKEFEKQQARQALVWKGIKSQIMGVVLPPLTWLVEKTVEITNMFRKWIEGTEIVETTLTVLGATITGLAGPIIAAGIAMAAPFVAMVVAIALIALAVEDLVAFLQGRSSVIGGLIDKLLGKGESLIVLNAIKMMWHDIVTDLKKAVGYAREFFNWMTTAQDSEAGQKAFARVHAAGGSFWEATKAGLQSEISGEAPAIATGMPRANIGGASPAAGGVSVAPTVNVQVQAPPSSDPKAWGKVVGDVSGQEMQRAIKGAMATYPRAGSQ